MAMALALIGFPDCLIAAIAPSMRGWMLRAPGVAMNSATSPSGTSPRCAGPWRSPSRRAPGRCRPCAPSPRPAPRPRCTRRRGCPPQRPLDRRLERPLVDDATAMPAALALIAALNALIILATSAVLGPSTCTSSRERAASAAPYCVGTKNGLVVTWLMKANFHFGCLGVRWPLGGGARRTPTRSSRVPAATVRRRRPRSASAASRDPCGVCGSPPRSSPTPWFVRELHLFPPCGGDCAVANVPRWQRDVQLFKYRMTEMPRNPIVASLSSAGRGLG